MYKPTKAQKVRALRAARKDIKSAKHTFICSALPEDKVGDYLRDYIMKKLGGYSTYASWMREMHPKEWIKADWYDMREARVQWINWMIANAT